jgi:hypothetical protein
MSISGSCGLEAARARIAKERAKVVFINITVLTASNLKE